MTNPMNTMYTVTKYCLPIWFAIGLILGTAMEAGANPDYEKWGKLASEFLLPLTYENHDPTDFGTSQGPAELKILEQFKPYIYIAPGGQKPIDFYEDYLPYCFLLDDENGYVVSTNPTRTVLKQYERHFGFCLDYTGPRNLVGTPTAYARVYHEEMVLKTPKGIVKLPMVFAKYSFVFLASGLTQKMAWYKRLAVAILGDVDWWHELDIHGAIILAAANIKGSLTPIALVLAQHNHFRTYLFGRDIPLPLDGHPKIGFALRSNEPYPLPNAETPVYYPVTGNPSEFDFVITGKGFSLTSGWDAVYGEQAGARPVPYQIRQLPDKDPLYVSWIPLGERKGIIGSLGKFYRSGPPGIDLMTWPEISKYSDTMSFWFVDAGDRTAAQLFKQHFSDFYSPEFEPIHRYNKSRFTDELLKLHPDLITAWK